MESPDYERMSSFRYVMKVQLVSMAHCIRDLIFCCLSTEWCTSRYIRPFMARLFGMKCGCGSTLRKGFCSGSFRNIKIGNNTFINSQVFFHTGARITIGDNVAVGFQVSFITGNHEIGPPDCRCGALVSKDIVVEDGVWIGTRALICPGVTIGAGSVVAAGAVVIRSVPPNSLIAGVPAKVVRKLEE